MYNVEWKWEVGRITSAVKYVLHQFATLLSLTERFTSEAKASRVTVSWSLTLNVLLKTYTSTLVDLTSTEVIISASSQPVRVGYIMLFSAYFKVNRYGYYQMKCTEVLEISHTQIFLTG